MLSCLCNRQSQFLVRLTLDAQCIHLLRGGEQFRCCRDQCRIWSGEIAVAVQAPHVGSAFVWPKHNPSWFLVRRKAFGLPRALCQFAHSLSSAPNTAVKRDGLRPPVTLVVLPLCRADKIRRLRCRHPAVAEELPVLHRHHAQLLVFVRVARRPCREVVGGLESVLPASFAKAVHQGRQWRDVRLLLCAHFRLRSCAGQNPSVVCDLRKKPRRPHTSVVSRHVLIQQAACPAKSIRPRPMRMRAILLRRAGLRDHFKPAAFTDHPCLTIWARRVWVPVGGAAHRATLPGAIVIRPFIVIAVRSKHHFLPSNYRLQRTRRLPASLR